VLCCTIIDILYRIVLERLPNDEKSLVSICLTTDQQHEEGHEQEQLTETIYKDLVEREPMELKGLVESTGSLLKMLIWRVVKLETISRMTYPRFKVCFETIGACVPLIKNCHQVIADGMEIKSGYCVIIFPGVVTDDHSTLRCNAFVCCA